MKWSITDSIYLFKSYDGSVFVANPEQKKLWGAVKKISESTADPELLKNEDLKVRFFEGRVELEALGKWRELRNVDILPPQFGQFSGATLISGVSEEAGFAFRSDTPERAALVFKGTTFYKTCEEEFNKKTIFGLYKKTRTLIPGHKYQSENMTYYYLGKVKCHRSEYNPTSYLSNPYEAPAFVIDPGTGSAEDIYRTYGVEYVNILPSVFVDKTIFIPSRLSSMVDLGEFLTLSGGSIEETWERRFLEADMEPYTFWSGKYHYKDSQRLFSILDLSTADNPQVSETLRDKVLDIIQTEIRHFLFGCYDVRIFSRDKCVVASDPESQQIQALESYIGSKLGRGLANYFWSTLKNLIGIDVDNLIETELKNFKTTYDVPKDSTFSDLLENFEFFRYRQSDKFDMTVNFRFVGIKNQNFTTFFGSGVYKKAIKTIFDRAIETGGENVTSYQVSNIGTVSKPLLQHTVRITLPDLMSHFNITDPNDFSEEIKQGILDNKNYNITLITDDNLTING